MAAVAAEVAAAAEAAEGAAAAVAGGVVAVAEVVVAVVVAGEVNLQATALPTVIVEQATGIVPSVNSSTLHLVQTVSDAARVAVGQATGRLPNRKIANGHFLMLSRNQSQKWM